VNLLVSDKNTAESSSAGVMMMARNSFPMMKTGSGLLGKIVGTVVVLGVLTFVVNHPTDAAHLLTMAIGWLSQAADGIASFLGQLHG
jgi:hypothetical protein